MPGTRFLPMKQDLIKTSILDQRVVSVLRVDIESSLITIEEKLLEKKGLLRNFLKIERKISEILNHNREDDILELISDETDLLEIINIIEYDISREKDYIHNKTGIRFEELTGKRFPQCAIFKEKIKKISAESAAIIEELAQHKAKNIELIENSRKDIAIQVRELELMNNLNIITPEDLQQL